MLIIKLQMYSFKLISANKSVKKRKNYSTITIRNYSINIQDNISVKDNYSRQSVRKYSFLAKISAIRFSRKSFQSD